MSRSGYVNNSGTRGHLYSLVGLPSSGKSLWANEWVKSVDYYDEYELVNGPGIVRPRVVLAGDDFRHAIYGQDYLRTGEALMFSILDTAAAALLLRGFDVLIDETSTSMATLSRYLRLDPDVELIFIDTPAEECKRRALENGRPELLHVIDRLSPRLENIRANWGSIREDLLGQVEHLVLKD